VVASYAEVEVEVEVKVEVEVSGLSPGWDDTECWMTRETSSELLDLGRVRGLYDRLETDRTACERDEDSGRRDFTK
jgi:hypothetical protein